MKRVWTLVTILCTLLLLVLGAFMPRLTAFFLDRKLEKELMQREDADISLELTLNLDFFRSLDIFRNQQAQIELTEGFRKTEEDITSAAESMILTFGNVYSAPEVKPFLITSRTSPSLSGVFWQCVWTDTSGGQEVLWIDDQSGLMVAFQGRIMVSTLSSAKEPVYFVQNSVSVMEEFCRSYYPVDEITVKKIEEKISLSDYEMTFVRHHDELVETYTVPIRLRGEQFFFNM